jgi:hypothetical protein
MPNYRVSYAGYDTEVDTGDLIEDHKEVARIGLQTLKDCNLINSLPPETSRGFEATLVENLDETE